MKIGKYMLGMLAVLVLAFSIMPLAMANDNGNRNTEGPRFQDMTFEEIQSHILERLDKGIEKLTERITGLEEKNKEEIVEKLNLALEKIKEHRDAVAAAASLEDLKKIHEKFKTQAGACIGMRLGNMKNMQRMHQNISEKFEGKIFEGIHRFGGYERFGFGKR
jgi:acyl-CoA reductase-like NAD-dependent aldehyde dehydrogenase